MPESLDDFVRRRARNRCEYCQLPDWLHPGPKQHGGLTEKGNRLFLPALQSVQGAESRRHHRDQRTTAVRPAVQSATAQMGSDFRWDGPYLIGRTPIGRVTVQVLAMNDPIRVEVRQDLILEELFP